MAYIDKYGVEFSDDRKTLVKCPKDFQGSCEIPNSVTSIGKWAFAGCRALTSVTVPNSVTSIGDQAFKWCNRLISLTIPDSVTNIGANTFEGCSGLTSIEIPNSVTSIGDGAFKWCDNLKEICVPRDQKARFAQMEGLSELADLIVERENEE